jgi:hypothetical protein
MFAHHPPVFLGLLLGLDLRPVGGRECEYSIAGDQILALEKKYGGA